MVVLRPLTEVYAVCFPYEMHTWEHEEQHGGKDSTNNAA